MPAPRSFTAVAEWVHDVPADVLDRLGIEGRPPSESTTRRAPGRLDAAALDQRIGVVLGQVEVGAKTNEIPLITDLLDALDLTDVVVTADALHCLRGTADHIVGRGGHCVFTVKNNQRSLQKLLKSFPWNDIPALPEHRHRPAAPQPRPAPADRPTSHHLTCNCMTLPGP
ncbi:ISAs1 family transposase [Rhodococcus zopfii]|uniref:ISAs1 family transposase n=1 Tax=Rhodococcus zopfii TaxID=43772 RepID=UPI000932E408|nr:ISAs1 family transposase [Rhodococcus zopfii]